MMVQKGAPMLTLHFRARDCVLSSTIAIPSPRPYLYGRRRAP